jgi:hypothetical protein
MVLEVDDYDFPLNYKPLAVSDRFWKKEAPEKVKEDLLEQAHRLQFVSTVFGRN